MPEQAVNSVLETAVADDFADDFGDVVADRDYCYRNHHCLPRTIVSSP